MIIRVPKRFQKATIETLQQTEEDREIFAPALEYYAEADQRIKAGEGLMLLGPPGVGKTWMTAALTHGVVSAKVKRGQFMDYDFSTAPDFFDRIQAFEGAEVAKDDLRGQSWLKTYTTVRWLVINDLGKEYREGKLNEQIVAKLGRVLRTRSEKTLTTHLTSNIPPGDFHLIYGASLASLLRESCRTFVINGPDRRAALG